MCYTWPGPRCSNHATEKVDKARERVRMALTPEAAIGARAALIEARREFYTTPAGFAELEDRISKEKSTNGEDSARAASLTEKLRQCKDARAGQLAAMKANGVSLENDVEEEEAGIQKCDHCGQFTGSNGHTCPESTGEPDHFILQTDLSSWTPGAVDSRLSELLIQSYRTQSEMARRKQAIKGVDKSLDPSYRYHYPAEIPRLLASKAKHQEEYDLYAVQLADIGQREDFYEAEFEARGGWTRAFIVTNVKGHVHKDRRCSTCRPTTEYAWLTDYSGKAEEDVVEAAGERACTVCYPSAPVETLNRPTTLFTPEERIQQADREERAQLRAVKAAEKAAKAITNPEGQELKLSGRFGERIATERTAQTKYVNLAMEKELHEDPSVNWSYFRENDQQDLNLLRASLAHKNNITEEELESKLQAKVAAKKRSWLRSS